MRYLLQQLLPLRYESSYEVVLPDGTVEGTSTWRMWFGRVFAHEETRGHSVTTA